MRSWAVPALLIRLNDGGLLDFLLAIDLTNRLLIGTFLAVSIAALAVLTARALAAVRSTGWKSVVMLVIGGAGGAAVAVVIIVVVEYWWNAFGTPLDRTANAFFVLTCAACGSAIVTLWGTGGLNRIVALIAIPVFLITGTLAINARYGLTPTVGLFVHAPNTHHLLLRPPTASADTDVALWKTWTPPVGMPAVGDIGSESIPSPISGFHSRSAGLYLPPAALGAHPPRLPFLILMMGQPGDPSAELVAGVLNKFAAAHHGLGPIVLVVDQLGDPSVDPLCIDSTKFGNVAKFIVRDVVNWARQNLNIDQDAAHWTVAGYSNGGECAVSVAARHPDIWGNVVDISGEEFPGSEHPAETLRDVFGGNQAAYDREKPVNILADHSYPQMLGVFTVGSDDASYLRGVQKLYAASLRAGMDANYYEVPNGGHVIGAINGGLEYAFSLLYPRLGLSEPPAH